MNDTPQTDDFEDGCINPAAFADFARTLERERDKWKKEAEELAAAFGCFRCRDHHTALYCRNCSDHLTNAENVKVMAALPAGANSDTEVKP